MDFLVFSLSKSQHIYFFYLFNATCDKNLFTYNYYIIIVY